MGMEQRFTPDLLATTATASVFVNLFEIALVKLGFYLLSVPTNIPFLDMCAYSGYKYVGIVLTILSGNFLGNMGYYPVLIFTSIATSYFMVSTLSYRLTIQVKTLRRAGVQTDDMRVRFDHNTAKRNYFVVFVALLQPIIFFLLSYSYSKQFVFSSLVAAATAGKAVEQAPQPTEPVDQPNEAPIQNEEPVGDNTNNAPQEKAPEPVKQRGPKRIHRKK